MGPGFEPRHVCIINEVKFACTRGGRENKGLTVYRSVHAYHIKNQTMHCIM